MEQQLVTEIRANYDAGYSLDSIAEIYRKKQKVDYNIELTKNKAYKDICRIVYDYIIERGSI